MADMPNMSQDPAAGAASTAAPILSKDHGPKMQKQKTEPRSQRQPGKKKHKHTHIEHHDDGTHTMRHTDAAGKETGSYTAQDLDGVHDGSEQHVGDANAPEAAPASADAAAGGDAAGGAPQ